MKKILLLILASLSLAFAQSLTHPHIWIKADQKSELLNKISTYQWATDLFNQYKNRVDPKVASHKSNPATLLNTIPGFPGDQKTHREILTVGYEAALLYWLTDNSDYGQLAADILSHYTIEIAKIDGDLEFTTGLSYSHLIDTREFYTKPPMIYDFLHAFLTNNTNTVYDLSSGTRKVFNSGDAQTAFMKMADEVFTKGSINSNHPILEAPGALFNLLSIEDDQLRASYMTKFLNGTPNQNGLIWMMDECKDASVWPEATGYSIGPHRIILELMAVVDSYDPSLNIITGNIDLVKNAFFFENYKFPNGTNVMRFGDAHRNSLNTVAIMERVLYISQNEGYATMERDAYAMLQSLYAEKGGYAPKVSTQNLEWNNPLYLLWGSNIETVHSTPIEYDRSINIDYAGIAMQRNINCKDEKQFGLMAHTGGAHYVHSHLTGIDMELYGLGAVIGSGGGDVGASRRNEDEFRNYHRIYAGHNTVIINGASKGLGKGAWKSDNQLFQNTTVTQAAEPTSLEPALSEHFSFSVQYLDDEINNAQQQRVLSVIRTSDSTGYYYDLFRSKSLGSNEYHDYVYHNVGDGVSMVDFETNESLALTAVPDRYQSTAIEYGGNTVEFPGWHYFDSVNSSAQTTVPVKASIPMTRENSGVMNIYMPGGESREYTSCFGPATIEAELGYENEKTPIVSVRQYGEAWKKGFVTIFEPSKSAEGTVKSVENIQYGGKIVGTKIVSVLETDTIVDYVLSNIFANDVMAPTSSGITFEGRFAIIREQGNITTLYVGDGKELTFNNFTLSAADRKGYQEFSTVLSTKTYSDTISTVIMSDSVENSTILIGDIEKEDTVRTTVMMDIYEDSLFTITDSLSNDSWFAADTILESVTIRNDTTGTTIDTLFFQGEAVSINAIHRNIHGGISDVIVTPNPVDQTAERLELIFPIELTGQWEIVIYDVLGNVLERGSCRTTAGMTYKWDLRNDNGAKVSSGSYVIIATCTAPSGEKIRLKRTIGIKQ